MSPDAPDVRQATYRPLTILEMVPTQAADGDPVSLALVAATNVLTLYARRFHQPGGPDEAALLVAYIERLVAELQQVQEQVRCLDDAYRVQRIEQLLGDAHDLMPYADGFGSRSPVIHEIDAARRALYLWRDRRLIEQGLCPRCRHSLHAHDDWGHCTTPGCPHYRCQFTGASWGLPLQARASTDEQAESPHRADPVRPSLDALGPGPGKETT